MGKQFDPYRKWLGIPEKHQPPTHYRLLGIEEFEHDPDVIETAADKQMMLLRTKQSSEHRELSQKLLNEVSAAKVCLLDRAKREAYNAQLRATSAQEQPLVGPGRPALPQPAPLPQAVMPSPMPAKPFPLITDPPGVASRPHWPIPIVMFGAGGAALLLLLVIGVTVVALSTSSGSASPVAQTAPNDADSTKAGLRIKENVAPVGVSTADNSAAKTAVSIPPRPAEPNPPAAKSSRSPTPVPMPPSAPPASIEPIAPSESISPPQTPLPVDLPGGTAPPLPKTNTPEDQLAFNRAMAEWALGTGRGRVMLLLPDSGKILGFNKTEALPDAAFMVVQCRIHGDDLEDGDLPRLVGLSKLEALDINSSKVSNEALAALAQSKSLRRLNLSYTSLDDPTLSQLCRGMPQLEELRIHKTPTTDRSLEEVGRLQNLKQLSVQYNAITDEGVAHLRGLQKLDDLNLGGTQITDEGLKHVAGLANLRVLHLWNTAIGTDGVEAISRLTNLASLYLVETNVDDEAWPHIAKLHSLIILDLRNCKKMSSSGLAQLRSLSKLLSLSLPPEVFDADLAALPEFPKLQSIRLSGFGVTDEGLKHLERFPTLSFISLTDTHVTDEGVARLQAALPKAHIHH